MVEYTCLKCGKVFKQKSNYLAHTELKKYPCDLKQENIVVPQNGEIIEKNTQKNSININDDSKKLNKISITSKKLNNIIIIDDDNDNNILQDGKKDDIIDVNNDIDDDNILNDNNKTLNEILLCKYCDKQYSRKDNLVRHTTKYCKAKKKFDDFEQLKQKYEDILEKYEELLAYKNETTIKHDNVNNTFNTTNTNNGSINSNNVSQNNSNNNITIVQFGKEDYAKIPNQLILKTIMSSTGTGIPCSLIEKLHFNKDYPEYQNVCITDLNRKYALIWNGKKWMKHKYEDIGIDMLDRCLCLISDRMDEIEKIVVDKKTFNIKKKALDRLENINSDDEAENSDEDENITRLKILDRQKSRKKASDKITEILHNNRDLINKK
jgi:hypothetical protein